MKEREIVSGIISIMIIAMATVLTIIFKEPKYLWLLALLLLVS